MSTIYIVLYDFVIFRYDIFNTEYKTLYLKLGQWTIY